METSISNSCYLEQTTAYNVSQESGSLTSPSYSDTNSSYGFYGEIISLVSTLGLDTGSVPMSTPDYRYTDLGCAVPTSGSHLVTSRGFLVYKSQ